MVRITKPLNRAWNHTARRYLRFSRKKQVTSATRHLRVVEAIPNQNQFWVDELIVNYGRIIEPMSFFHEITSPNVFYFCLNVRVFQYLKYLRMVLYTPLKSWSSCRCLRVFPSTRQLLNLRKSVKTKNYDFTSKGESQDSKSICRCQ